MSRAQSQHIKSSDKNPHSGKNDYGQLGISSSTSFVTTMNLALNIPRGLSRIDTGDYHACGVLPDTGEVLCWGKFYKLLWVNSS